MAAIKNTGKIIREKEKKWSDIRLRTESYIYEWCSLFIHFKSSSEDMFIDF